MLLVDLLQEFIFDLESRGYSPRTIKGYRNNNLRFMDYLKKNHGIDQLEKVQPIHFKSYFKNLRDKGRKETYVNSILKNIRAFFQYCVDEEYLLKRDNPILKVKWMKEEQVVIKTFNDAEIKGMINAYHTKDYLNIRNKVIILMLVDVGIRNLELCHLTHLQVMDTTILINGKGNKQRYVYISQYLKKYLIKYERVKELYFKDRILEHSNYFLSFTGKEMTREAVQRVVKVAGARAGVRKEIRCSPHTLRHYFTQKMLGTSDVYSISRLLGHEDIRITKRYLQSMEDEKILDEARSTSPLMSLSKK